MGMLVKIYRDDYDCDLNRFHGKKGLCVVNVKGPFSPNPEYPAAMLVKRGNDHVVVPVGDPGTHRTPWMDGGSYAATSDSRWSSVVGFSAIPIHDRSETWKNYYQLSR